MDNKRRRFLKGAAAAGGGAAFVAGYAGPLEKMGKGILNGTAGVKPADNLHGNSLAPEYTVDPKTGDITLNPDQRMAYTVCYGCTTLCGVRVRIDNKEDRPLRITGNPYHPLSSDQHLDERIPVMDALRSVSGFQEQGLVGRSTACARGNAAMEQVTSNKRVTHCMKRVGPRGNREWQKISFEQLLQEVVEGGEVFGEGHIDGLRAIHDHKTPLDPDNPEYGPKANQLMVMEATDYGRSALLKRFAFNAYGTRNYGHHGSYCGLAFRMGSGALLNDLAKNAHTKPDYNNARFAIFMGTAPSQAGNPFKRQGRLLAEARATGNLEYVVVDPALNAAASHAAGERSRWIPIKPGSDSALAMGIMRWLFENDAYAADYLAIPGNKGAAAADEAGHSNATHLFINSPEHPRVGQFLRRSDLGLAKVSADDDHAMVMQDNGNLAHAEETDTARLFVDTVIETPQGEVSVKSSLSQLQEEAIAHSFEEYAEECGVNVKTITGLARKFASHGRQSVVDTHGGMMSGSGFYTSWAILMLNLLAGSFNHKGGSLMAGGQFNGLGNGPRYDLDSFPGKVGPKGIFLSRSRFPYEKTSEYKRKVAAGQNPYPASAPWRTLAPPALTEHLLSGLYGYPYKLKAIISCMANPLYGQTGLNDIAVEKLKNPKALGLFVAVDGFINETNRYADYLVPDSVMYEVWGFSGAWSGTRTRMTTACWPVVEPRQQKMTNGDEVSMDSFFIAVAKALDLPGFGDNAIPDSEGNLHPLNRAEDFYLRGAANVSFMGKPLPSATTDDIAAGGIISLMPRLQRTLKHEEIGPVAHLYSRGGRFESHKEAFKGNNPKYATKPICVYNEQVASTIDSYSGERLKGTPHLTGAKLWNGCA